MINQTRIAKIAAAALAAGTLIAATAAYADPNDYPGSNSYPRNNYTGHYWSHHDRDNRGYNNGPGYGYGYNDGGGLVAGLLGGLFAGAVVNSYNQPYYNGNSCYRFRTYNPTTGMYMSYDGPRHCPKKCPPNDQEGRHFGGPFSAARPPTEQPQSPWRCREL